MTSSASASDQGSTVPKASGVTTRRTSTPASMIRSGQETVIRAAPRRPTPCRPGCPRAREWVPAGDGAESGSSPGELGPAPRLDGNELPDTAEVEGREAIEGEAERVLAPGREEPVEGDVHAPHALHPPVEPPAEKLVCLEAAVPDGVAIDARWAAGLERPPHPAR